MKKPLVPSKAASVELSHSNNTTIEKLTTLVKGMIASEPFEFDSSVWAKVNRSALSKELGISPDLFTKVINHDPFVYDKININGVITILLRLEPRGPLTARTVGKGMVKIWPPELKSFNLAKHKRELEVVVGHEVLAVQFAKAGDMAMAMSHKLMAEKHSVKAAKAEADSKVNRKPNPNEYGCFVGMAEMWGPDYAVKILIYIIRNWLRFMVLLKNENSLDINLDKKLSNRHYEFPNAALIRKFWWLAFDMALHDFQECAYKSEPSLLLAMAKVVDGKSLANSPYKKVVIDLVCASKNQQ